MCLHWVSNQLTQNINFQEFQVSLNKTSSNAHFCCQSRLNPSPREADSVVQIRIEEATGRIRRRKKMGITGGVNKPGINGGVLGRCTVETRSRLSKDKGPSENSMTQLQRSFRGHACMCNNQMPPLTLHCSHHCTSRR